MPQLIRKEKIFLLFHLSPDLLKDSFLSQPHQIFREHHSGPACKIFRRPGGHSLQIQHDSRAILTESPYDHPPRYLASPRTIQTPNPRCIRFWSSTRTRRGFVVADPYHWHSRHRVGLSGGRRLAVPKRCHQARSVLAIGHHKGLQARIR